jgi:hypothetical protein
MGSSFPQGLGGDPAPQTPGFPLTISGNDESNRAMRHPEKSSFPLSKQPRQQEGGIDFSAFSSGESVFDFKLSAPR